MAFLFMQLTHNSCLKGTRALECRWMRNWVEVERLKTVTFIFGCHNVYHVSSTQFNPRLTEIEFSIRSKAENHHPGSIKWICLVCFFQGDGRLSSVPAAIRFIERNKEMRLSVQLSERLFCYCFLMECQYLSFHLISFTSFIDEITMHIIFK